MHIAPFPHLPILNMKYKYIVIALYTIVRNIRLLSEDRGIYQSIDMLITYLEQKCKRNSKVSITCIF